MDPVKSIPLSLLVCFVLVSVWGAVGMGPSTALVAVSGYEAVQNISYLDYTTGKLRVVGSIRNFGYPVSNAAVDWKGSRIFTTRINSRDNRDTPSNHYIVSFSGKVLKNVSTAFTIRAWQSDSTSGALYVITDISALGNRSELFFGTFDFQTKKVTGRVALAPWTILSGTSYDHSRKLFYAFVGRYPLEGHALITIDVNSGKKTIWDDAELPPFLNGCFAVDATSKTPALLAFGASPDSSSRQIVRVDLTTRYATILTTAPRAANFGAVQHCAHSPTEHVFVSGIYSDGPHLFSLDLVTRKTIYVPYKEAPLSSLMAKIN